MTAIIHFSKIAKQIILLSNPRLWVYSVGMYLVGLTLGFSYKPAQVILLSVSTYIAYFLWLFAVGVIAGFSHHPKSSNLIFPWELVVLFLRSLIFRNRTSSFAPAKEWDTDAKISAGISGAFIVLFILLMAFSFNAIIFALGVGMVAVNFLYNSHVIEAKYLSPTDVLCGAIYIIPLLIGYVAVAGLLPSSLLIFAGALYCIATELYAGVPSIEDDLSMKRKTSVVLLGKRASIVISAILTVICGGILASYNPVYFTVVLPFLIILGVSFVVERAEALEYIYNKSFFFHSAGWFLVAFFNSFSLASS